MVSYKSIKDMEVKALPLIPEYVDLLQILEEVNPCDQVYDIRGNSLVISYIFKLNLLNFFGRFSLHKKTRIIGLPISICHKGYFGDLEAIKDIIKSKKGLTLVLNGDQDLGSKSLTLSSFIFENKFENFQEYINSLRSPYRRRVSKAIAKKDKLKFEKIRKEDFNEDHYSLYKSVVDRSENPLEILPLDFFKSYDSHIYEITCVESGRLLAFFQLKEFANILNFLFCGFETEDNNKYDLYYNLLLRIVAIGIDTGVESINFGQTSEESKLKIGCREERKYLAIHHSNPIINRFLHFLLPVFSYKPYNISHNVFKKE